MSKLSQAIRKTVQQGSLFDAVVLDTYGNKASVRLSGTGTVYTGLDVVGGEVSVGQIVHVSFSSSKPLIFASPPVETGESTSDRTRALEPIAHMNTSFDHALNGHTDTDLANPSDGDTVTWSDEDGKWIAAPSTPSSGSGEGIANFVSSISGYSPGSTLQVFGEIQASCIYCYAGTNGVVYGANFKASSAGTVVVTLVIEGYEAGNVTIGHEVFNRTKNTSTFSGNQVVAVVAGVQFVLQISIVCSANDILNCVLNYYAASAVDIGVLGWSISY